MKKENFPIKKNKIWNVPGGLGLSYIWRSNFDVAKYVKKWGGKFWWFIWINCFTLIWKWLIYNELRDAVKNLWPAINVTASMSIRREVRSPFKECAKKRSPYKKERLSHILATNVFGLTNSVTKFMVELAWSKDY